MAFKGSWIGFLLAVCALSLGMFATVAPAQEGAGDPDRPEGLPTLPFANYLDKREHQIAGYTGVGANLPYNPRQRAIRKYERDRARNGLSAEAGADYTGGDLVPLGLSTPSSFLGVDMIPPTAGLAPPPNQTTWTPLGPAPTPNGQTSPAGPVSGRITAIAVDPNQADTVYAGTAQGGVYRSKDGGLTWTPIFDQAQSLAIGALALAPSNPSILYVGTGEGSLSGDSFAGVGLYRVDNADTSADLVGPIDPPVSINFTSGTQQVGAFGGRGISAIAVKPDDPATVFVATSSGIIGRGGEAARGGTSPPLPPRGVYRSTNATAAPGAVSFTKLTVTTANSVDTPGTGNVNVTSMMFEPGTSDHLVVGIYESSLGGGGIWRSTDANGASPTFAQSLPLSGVTGRVALDGTRTGGVTTMIAGTAESNGRISRSTDGGATWTTVATPAFCGGQCFYDVAVGIKPDDPNTMLAGGAGPGTIIKRTINGSIFTSSEAGLHADTHAIAFAPSSPSVVYTGNDGGVWRSSDGGATWVNRNTTGLSATQFQSIAVLANNPVVTLGGTQDNGTQLQETTSGDWRRADYGDGGFALIDQNGTSAADATMYHTYFNQTNNLIALARVTGSAAATDGNWTALGCGIGIVLNGINCADSVEFYAPMALGPGNPNTLYFGTNKLYRSVNQGTTMSTVSQTFASNLTAIGIGSSNDSVRLVGLRSGRVYLTTTGSSTMTDVTGPWPTAYVARTVVDPSDANVAYVTVNGYSGATAASDPSKSHVWRTTNLLSGTPTWTSAGNGLPDTPVNAFVADPVVPGRVFAGTDVGVYRSNDGGASWVPLGSGLPVVATFDMVVAPAGVGSEVLRVATHGRGMWELAISTQPPDTSITTGPPTITNSSSPTFAFTSTADGASFECRLDGTAFSPCNSPKQYSNLAEGSHTFEVRSIDGGGLVDPSPATRTVTVDQTPPDTTIVSGPTGSIPIASAAFAFSSSEAGSSFQCKLDGGDFAACASPKNYAALADGPHTFSVRATDTAGNTDASPTTRTFTVTAAACNQAKASLKKAKASLKKAKASNVAAKIKKAKAKVKKAKAKVKKVC